MRNWSLSVFGLVFALSLVPNLVLAWSNVGHEIVAYMAAISDTHSSITGRETARRLCQFNGSFSSLFSNSRAEHHYEI